MGHEDQFPPPTLSVRRRFGEATFAGTLGNGREAPITDLRCRVTSLTPATAKSGDVRLTPERKIAPQLFGIEGITSRTIGVRSAQSLRPPALWHDAAVSLAE
jgi:hypothetical protein